MSVVGLTNAGKELDKLIDLLVSKTERQDGEKIAMEIRRRLNKYVARIKWVHKQRYRRSDILTLAREYYLADYRASLSDSQHWFDTVYPLVCQFLADVCHPDFKPDANRYHCVIDEVSDIQPPVGYIPEWNTDEWEFDECYDLVDDIPCSVTYSQLCKAGMVLVDMFAKCQSEKNIELEHLLNTCIKWAYAILYYEQLKGLQYCTSPGEGPKKDMLDMVYQYYTEKLAVDFGEMSDNVLSYSKNVIYTATRIDCLYPLSS